METKIWNVFYYEKPKSDPEYYCIRECRHDLYIGAKNFDAALKIAHNIDSKFSGGQIVEPENIPSYAIVI